MAARLQIAGSSKRWGRPSRSEPLPKSSSRTSIRKPCPFFLVDRFRERRASALVIRSRKRELQHLRRQHRVLCLWRRRAGARTCGTSEADRSVPALASGARAPASGTGFAETRLQGSRLPSGLAKHWRTDRRPHGASRVGAFPGGGEGGVRRDRRSASDWSTACRPADGCRVFPAFCATS